MVPWTLSLARRDEGRPSGAGTVEGREIGIGELIFGIAERSGGVIRCPPKGVPGVKAG